MEYAMAWYEGIAQYWCYLSPRVFGAFNQVLRDLIADFRCFKYLCDLVKVEITFYGNHSQGWVDNYTSIVTAW